MDQQAAARGQEEQFRAGLRQQRRAEAMQGAEMLRNMNTNDRQFATQAGLQAVDMTINSVFRQKELNAMMGGGGA